MTKTQDLPDFDSVWDYHDPAATEERFREIAAATRESGGLGYRTELATQIARTYSLRGEFDKAHAELDAVGDDLGGAGAVARSRYLLERGRTYNSAGERERATELFLKAWELADQHGAEPHAADALHMLGISTPPEEALAWNARAMEYCEAAEDEQARRFLGPLYHNSWYSHLELGEFERALAYAEKSREFRASIDDEEGERIGRWSTFHTYRKMGRAKEALDGFTALLADYGPEGDPTGYTDEELGECLHALGKAEEARPHFASAYEALKADPWMVENESDRLARLAELSGV
jgi:tetratricopeptide (TPR) repeat protein